VRTQHDGDEERLLVERVTISDHEAFEALFLSYLSTVYRQAIRLLGNQAEAEEVVQELFLTVYEKAQMFRGHSAFSTWLYRITMNAALTKLRQRRRTQAVSLDDFLPRYGEDGHHLQRPAVDWSKDLEERLADEEINRLLLQALDQLPSTDRTVVVLSDREGHSDREIGAVLGLSVSAVKARLHRSRLFLRGRLAVALGYSPTRRSSDSRPTVDPPARV
jgi:RNA polymerase sigma-70 factor (ECF subfamily)